MKLTQYGVICFCIIGITACDSNENPVKNPHPKYFVMVSGNISLKLKKPMYYVIWATYVAHNSKCQKMINWFEGVKGYYAKTDRYLAKPNNDGNYVIKIPIDGYFSGKCRWSMDQINYHVDMTKIPKNKYDAEQASLLFFNNSYRFGNLPVRNQVTVTVCNKGKYLFCGGNTLTPGNSSPVPLNKNYYFIQNF